MIPDHEMHSQITGKSIEASGNPMCRISFVKIKKLLLFNIKKEKTVSRLTLFIYSEC